MHLELRVDSPKPGFHISDLLGGRPVMIEDEAVVPPREMVPDEQRYCFVQRGLLVVRRRIERNLLVAIKGDAS
jgi:hypothetical protein